MPSLTFRRISIAAATTLVVLAVGFRLLPRYPSLEDSSAPYPVEKLAEQLDPWLLGDGFSRVTVVEIAWVEGCKPGPETIGGLEAILHEYSPNRHPCEVIVDQEIPLARWNELKGSGDAMRRIADTYARAERALVAGTEWRYVLFVPELGAGYFGYSSTVWTLHDGKAIPVSFVSVSRDAHARYAHLWLSFDRMEEMTLVHEFGHVLGLVQNPQHERGGQHQGHCTSLDCPMAHPTPRVIARNFFPGLLDHFMHDYCDACKADIRRAQQFWRDRETEGPTYRLRRDAERESQRVRMEAWLHGDRSESIAPTQP
ncbi:MAG TPA: hypothetical protein VFV19_01420 [Candidatus Polarisedimenticolaceae bacterium]|nr:hypothetical protein [Candidatus Polarisedimenticolaceae bacterium]